MCRHVISILFLLKYATPLITSLRIPILLRTRQGLRMSCRVPEKCLANKYAIIKGIYIGAILFQVGSFFAKASIFLLFSQIFTIQKSMRVAIWVGLVFDFLLYGTGIGVASYYETPHMGETWVDTLDGRSLIPLPWWQAQSALSIALDLYIFVLPLPAVARLKLPIRKRISVMAVFSLALM